MSEKIKILGAAGIPKEMVERLEQEIGPVEVLSSDSEEEIIKAIKISRSLLFAPNRKLPLTLFRMLLN